MMVSWPGRVAASDKVRSQWHHVIDVAPTVLVLATSQNGKLFVSWHRLMR
jgi:arylsulfatase A-like enzyme